MTEHTKPVAEHTLIPMAPMIAGLLIREWDSNPTLQIDVMKRAAPTPRTL